MSTNLDAAGAAFPLRRRRFTRRSVVRIAAPYALIAPAIVVIAAILAYPLYFLVRLSLQRYGLFQLIAHKGSYVGLHNYGVLLHDSVRYGHRPSVAPQRLATRQAAARAAPPPALGTQ